MNYAIVEIGGRQFMVKKGDTILVSHSLDQSKKSININKILMCHLGNKIEVGNPYIKGASLVCEVIGEKKSKKVIAYKYRRRKSSKFKKGHRQKLLVFKVKEINIE